MKTISIVSPCYNEEENVAECYRTVRELFARELPDYRLEHVFADNASEDRTVEILEGLAAEDPNVKVIVNARNYGVFRSTFNALRYATGDAVIVMLPVDLQDPPELIPQFVQLWEAGNEVVLGARSIRQESTVMRTSRKLFYRIVNGLSDFRIEPDVGEFSLLDRKAVNAVLAHEDNYPYIRGIIASVGFRKTVVHYTWRARKRGVSKHNLPMLVDQALNAIFAFTRAPMRLCTLAGFGIAFLSIAFAIFSVLYYLIAAPDAPRGTTTIITALFFLSGVQLMFIGMLGEYVMAIHAQVRGGPMVVERDRVNVDPQAETKPAKSTPPRKAAS